MQDTKITKSNLLFVITKNNLLKWVCDAYIMVSALYKHGQGLTRRVVTHAQNMFLKSGSTQGYISHIREIYKCRGYISHVPEIYKCRGYISHIPDISPNAFDVSVNWFPFEVVSGIYFSYPRHIPEFARPISGVVS